MTAVLIGQHETGSDAWHELRTRGLGGSEIAAVVGLSPWMSAFELFHRKIGNLPGQASTPQMDWGNRLEPLVAAEFADRHPEFHVREAGTYAHVDRPWQIANVDRELKSKVDVSTVPYRSILEVKTARFPDGWGHTGSDLIPLHYRCQVMWYMDVLGVDTAWVAVLIGGSDYREYFIDYSPEDAAALRDAGAAFWESLQTGDEPPLDASESTYQTVRELHPSIDGSDLELDPNLYHEHVARSAQLKDAERDARDAKTRVLDQMGNARRGLLSGVPVLRRQPGRGGSISLYPIEEKS